MEHHLEEEASSSKETTMGKHGGTGVVTCHHEVKDCTVAAEFMEGTLVVEVGAKVGDTTSLAGGKETACGDTKF